MRAIWPPQIQAALKSELQATVVPAMARIVMHSMENNLLKPVKLELQKALTTQLMPKLETKLEKLVTTTVAAQMAPLLPALGQQVATEMLPTTRKMPVDVDVPHLRWESISLAPPNFSCTGEGIMLELHKLIGLLSKVILGVGCIPIRY